MEAQAVPLGLPAWTWLAQHPWLYPALEAVHVCGIALLLGSLVLVELRVWGAAPTLSVPALARLALPVTLAGFGVAAASGVLMFSSQPGDLLANRYFALKMALLLAAGSNAAIFHARGGLRRLDAWARAQTALSLGLWIAVIICGRWIAYA
ncbi:hypothetical protein [Methylibium sp. Root1272]|uniref:hypothetical protein n=1 Tax=Methylibium sp. Root1272 TaxID=1736441 RepID=UPI0006FF970A|nr:hypothetical protein [Methylibium sp. Root1272]KQW69647.1 hypothetical protein ASC67_03875 [Methylibium sp. Root1272]